MIKIGLLSDTHGFIDERLFTFFEPCQEIWHAGDIGNLETATKLDSFKPLRAVFGNIDGTDIRQQYKSIERFDCEQTPVLITHIGGYPGHYDQRIQEILKVAPPKLFICGHSHILKVMWDKQLNFLHINPGAAGNSGFHKVKTAVRFTIDSNAIKDLEVWEAARI
jgi:putative phosphoesterase